MDRSYHSLLRRQLKKIFGESFTVPQEWNGFIAFVNAAYHEFDTDRNMLERSLELSSQELLQANAEMRVIFETLPDLFLRISHDGVILDCKAGHSPDLFVIRNHIIGKRIYDIPLLDAGNKFHDSIRLVHETSLGTTMEYSLISGEKELFYEARFLPLLDDQIIVIVRNITKQRQAAVAIQEAQRRLADIIEFLPDATLVIDRDSRVIAWNLAMEAMTGVKAQEMLGKGNYEYALPFYGTRRPMLIDLVLHPHLEEEILYTSIQRKEDVIFTEKFVPALGSGNVHVAATASALRDSRGEIVGAIECIRDNTDRRSMEERLQRAKKMESLGVLAGGVAHDLNNVLGVLVGYAELLLREVSEGSRASRYAESILKGGERAAAIIHDLLTMARRGVSVSETVNLNRIVAEAFKAPEFELIRYRHPEVLFRSDMEEGLLNIKGSPVHLGKMLMNLLSNAAEAISGAGMVSVGTQNRYVDVTIPGYENMREGEYAVLTVTDTGAGIDPADMGRIFEPFYTRKVMGRSGTGLGLAVVWGTVKDHGGYIDVSTEEKKGSAFSLYFPVTRDAVSKRVESVSEEEYLGRGERVLVVDDVEEQRLLATTILEGLNYRVSAAASGEKAVEYLKTHPADLVILDMIMEPGIDGLETYRRILGVRPGQKAIIVSGFAKTERVSAAQGLGAGEYVKKPYVIEKLGMAVRRELDRK